MATPRLIIKRLDTYPAIVATIKDDNGDTVDLTNADSVYFSMKDAEGGDLKVAGQVASFKTPRTAGQVQYNWQDGDTDTSGEYEAEFLVTWPTGKDQRAPQKQNLLITIMPEIS